MDLSVSAASDSLFVPLEKLGENVVPIEDIATLKDYFSQNRHPYWFIHHSPIHVLGLQKDIAGLRFLCPVDWFKGQLPELYAPVDDVLKDGIFDAHFLKRPEVSEIIRSAGVGAAAFLFFDQEIESITQSLDLKICFPSAQQRQQLDDKCEGNRLAEEAGVLPAPYIISKVTGFESLLQHAEAAGLGRDWVVQTPQGNSGQTTFFISSKEDYQLYAQPIEAESEVRIMKRLKCRSVAVEGCITQAGVIVGAPMNDLVGCPELTPVAGGWCGNEVAPGLFSEAQTEHMREGTIKLGQALQKRGYWGCFEVDWLVEEGTGTPYFGEINARFSGATVLSNLTSDAIGAPLFLFHLAEFKNLSLAMDMDTLNAQAIDPQRLESWSSLIIKHLENEPVYVESSPAAGIWSSDKQQLHYRPGVNIRDIKGEDEAFWLPEVKEGNQLYRADILGRVLLRGRITNDVGHLTARARMWIQAIRNLHTFKAGRHVAA